MMKNSRQSFSFDASSAISCGARDYQEDAMVLDFPNGDELGFVVLADGMGGHAAGDIASKIVVTEMFRELTFQRDKMCAQADHVCDVLQAATLTANGSLERHVQSNPDTNGMGATLVCAVVTGGQLYWVSIGDSPLFLFRDGVLRQLNEDHSMAEQIDLMVEKGMISSKDAENHPDRNVLTSVLFGAPISRMDCPAEPIELHAGDTLIIASDGLQFLSDDKIGRVLRDLPLSRSKEIAEALMTEVTQLNDPDLDNVTFSVIQITNSRHEATAMDDHDAFAHDVPLAPLPTENGRFDAPARLSAMGFGLFAGKSQG
ncbi:protein phosphatase 2C domain-containing protein [Litoreibacter sp.]|nr:protein phosphatase 2C domain-containing protein [Litoreibacter sp.]